MAAMDSCEKQQRQIGRPPERSTCGKYLANYKNMTVKKNGGTWNNQLRYKSIGTVGRFELLPNRCRALSCCKRDQNTGFSMFRARSWARLSVNSFISTLVCPVSRFSTKKCKTVVFARAATGASGSKDLGTCWKSCPKFCCWEKWFWCAPLWTWTEILIGNCL